MPIRSSKIHKEALLCIKIRLVVALAESGDVMAEISGKYFDVSRRSSSYENIADLRIAPAEFESELPKRPRLRQK